MIKTINIFLVLLLIIGVVLLTIQKRDYSDFRLQKVEFDEFYFSYNTISIKQIDSLSSHMNLRFSELFAEKVKHH